MKFSKWPLFFTKTRQSTFLLFLSISLLFLLVNCQNNTNQLDVPSDSAPELLGGESQSLAYSMFKTIGDGALGQVGGSGATYLMGAIGLADSSPDYTQQLDQISGELQEIIGELNSIEGELSTISTAVGKLTCSEWIQDINTNIGTISTLYDHYTDKIQWVEEDSTHRVTDDDVYDWAQQVLAIGDYSSRTDVETALTNIANDLTTPESGIGLLYACLDSTVMSIPVDGTFDDTEYYNKVSNLTNYFYIWQIKGLLILNEALHYMAWKDAVNNGSKSISITDMSAVCQDVVGGQRCLTAARVTNTVYNRLLKQFIIAGAPYSNDSLIIENHNSDSETSSFLWPRSIEAYNEASGNPRNCEFPQSCAVNYCNRKANSFDDLTVYWPSYSKWQSASGNNLKNLLSGWKSGTAGQFLTSTYNFQNMSKKIIISTSRIKVTLQYSVDNKHWYNADNSTYGNVFFDTDFDYKFKNSPGPFSTQSDFRKLTPFHLNTGECHDDIFIWDNKYATIPNADCMPYGPSFYVGHANMIMHPDCENQVNFQWYAQPGWSSTLSQKFADYWPVLPVSKCDCDPGRSAVNPGGVYTMCGDDFTAWFSNIVPKPASCDDYPSYPCN